MEQTYAYSSWLFARAISLVYLIAFVSLVPQARGLWGDHGITPIKTFMKAVEKSVDNSRYWELPSVFWLSDSDNMIYGAAVVGAVAAGLALVGCAQGWSLLICLILYLSFMSSGQEFMSFQWDALLIEVGFLALFVVPWSFDFSLSRAIEPHWLVRGMFYVVLFKLMFLSGVVKLMSGDESWRDLTALSYHYWTQPLPNPVSPFMYALPMWFHKIETVMTFAVELVAPFFIVWPRARPWAALVFVSLSLLIFCTGNYTFFNLLTMTLCLWLVPDNVWQTIMPAALQVTPAKMFFHPVLGIVMGGLALVSFIWCTRFWLPGQFLEWSRPVLEFTQTFHISNSYGLFATMTKSRPEIVIEGSLDGQTWKEYEFRYKPGDVNRRPPVIEPLQPRLDWQMWFAALGTLEQNPWITNVMLRIFQNTPEVMAFFVANPFGDQSPKFLRARVYQYTFTTPSEIFSSGRWWDRTSVGMYTPVFAKP